MKFFLAASLLAISLANFGCGNKDNSNPGAPTIVTSPNNQCMTTAYGQPYGCAGYGNGYGYGNGSPYVYAYVSGDWSVFYGSWSYMQPLIQCNQSYFGCFCIRNYLSGPGYCSR